MAKIEDEFRDKMQEKIEWSSFEDDLFWEQLVEDMEEEGYCKKDGSYHWVEMSYNKYGKPTDWFYESPEEEKELSLYLED